MRESDYSERDTASEEGQILLPGAPLQKQLKGRYNRISAGLIFLFPALGGLLFGYDIGATSAVVAQLTSKSYSGTKWHSTFDESSVLQGVVTSIAMFGAMLGSTTCFQIADDLGRRRTLIISSCFFMVGSVVEAVSGSSTWNAVAGISVLLAGRVLYGYGCGFAMHGAPAYIGEMAPSEIRGLLVSLKEAFIVLGMVFGYTIGYLFSTTSGGWRLTYLAAAPVSVIMFAGMYYLPYSARWLALKGRNAEARAALQFVTPDVSEADLQAITEVADKAAMQQSTQSSDWKRLTAPTVWPALVAGVGLVLIQQVTGQPSVLYYADSIFEDVGIDRFASIGVSLFKLVATLFATFTVDNYGRKLLLYIGCSLMLVALLLLGVAFMFPYTSAAECNVYTDTFACPTTCVWQSACSASCADSGYGDDDCQCCDVVRMNTQKGTILTALFIYIGGYQVGFGPISWLLISEIFPLEVRGKAVSIAVVTNFFWNTLVSFLFPIEFQVIGSSATFFLFAFILAWGMYFIFLKVPETKGLSLEQIEEFFLRLAGQSPGSEYAKVEGKASLDSLDKSPEKSEVRLLPVL